MPGPYGVVATGFNAKTLEEIRADLDSRIREKLGSSIDLTDTSALGQVVGIFADRLADAWQLGQGIYGAAFPDSAVGVPQDQIASLTGTTRQPATRTTVSVTFTGTPTTLIPTGSIVAVPDVPSAQFETTGDLTIGGGGTVAGVVTCLVTGPVPALAGTVTEIVTPIAGLASVVNASDQITLGRDVEQDSALRLRREGALRAIGGAAFEAIRARVQEVPGVTDCFVFENATDGTIDTIPPHSFETVVRGGADAAIAAVIFAVKPTGIGTHGSTTELVADSQGGSQSIEFTRPAALNIYVEINVTVDARAPFNVGDLIAEAVVAFGDLNYRTGSPVYPQAMVPTVFAVSSGVIDVDVPFVDVAASPAASTPIFPTRRQIADLDTSRIVVNVNRI